MPMKVILALPAYNESENLPPLVEDAVRVFGENGYEYEIIAVNDGSTDNTLEVLRDLAQKFPGIRVVDHPENRGLGGAIRTGFETVLQSGAGDNDILVNMDADNTHSPSYIPGMVRKIEAEGFDVVIASRFREGSKEVGVPLGRLILSRGARLLFRIFLRLPDVRDYTCGYRAYRVGVIRQLCDKYGDQVITRRGFACTDEVLLKLSTLTKKITEVPFILRYDQKRTPSKLPLFRTIWETLKMLILHR